MSEDLLIVFSNYNGYRSINDLRKPRISITIDSFIENVIDPDCFNVLLLDNNSTDSSENLLKKYINNKWLYRRKNKEDYYLGTLFYLVQEFKNKYKFIMVVDNDQYFFRSGFMNIALDIMRNNKNVVCIQLNESTIADKIDTGKHNNIDGIFDYIGKLNGEYWLLSRCFTGEENFVRRIPRKHGKYMINIRGYYPKRACWMWYAYSNAILRMDSLNEIFQYKKLKMPFKNNRDRMAIFSCAVNDKGRTAWLETGGSINIGQRRKLPYNFSLKKLMEDYKRGKKGGLKNSKSAFFYKNNTLIPLYKVL